MLYCVLTGLATVCSYAVRRALSLFLLPGSVEGGGVSYIYIYHLLAAVLAEPEYTVASPPPAQAATRKPAPQ